jgi:hypothetical protein
LTFDLFKEEDLPPADEVPVEEAEEDAENPKPPKPVEEQFPRHIYVPEVVREPRMFFYKVPKLGSYLIVKLEYNSCLFEESLD